MIENKAEKNGETRASGMFSDSFTECMASSESTVQLVRNSAILLVSRRTKTVLKQAMITTCENHIAAGQRAGESNDSVNKTFQRFR